MMMLLLFVGWLLSVKSDLLLLSQCDSTYNYLSRSVPEIH